MDDDFHFPSEPIHDAANLQCCLGNPVALTSWTVTERGSVFVKLSLLRSKKNRLTVDTEPHCSQGVCKWASHSWTYVMFNDTLPYKNKQGDQGGVLSGRFGMSR